MARSASEKSLARLQMEAEESLQLQTYSPRQWLVQGAVEESFQSQSFHDNHNDLNVGLQKHSDERLDVMVKLCRRSALLPSGVLDKKLQNMTVAVGKTGATGAFFSSRPVSAALAKWPWRLFLVLLACGSAALTSSFLDDLDRTRTGGPFFAFVPLLSRNGTSLRRGAAAASGAPGRVADFKLLHNGCALQGGHSRWEDAMLLLAFEAEVDFNGYEFTTAPGSLDDDPVMFESWESAASSAGPWSVASFTECARPLPEARGALVREDWRRGWRPRWMVTVLSYGLATILFLAASGLAISNQCDTAKGALGLALLLVCSGYVASLSRTPLSICTWESSTALWAIAFAFSITLWLALVLSILAESHHNLGILMAFGGTLLTTKLIELFESFREGTIWEKYWAAGSSLTLYAFVAAGESCGGANPMQCSQAS